MHTVIPSDAPRWVADSLHETPWVVVRRARCAHGVVPVGVRGATRAQRHALTVALTTIAEVVTPEDLSRREPPARAPAFEALRMVRNHLSASLFRWGPTGSVGFELATGTPTVHPDSDLDLLIRAPVVDPTTMRLLRETHGILADQNIRVDCQVETDGGAVALSELCSGSVELMIRTADGPALVDAAALSR
ncbi:phosphoribosyl-dephospho-CoA transferase [Mycolicibacterium rutilum]|uniref:Phosphoribosyl-dephospho-CoA transferase n=1 Tax=Mycolicibacterium rutilum TaxID=370526 RepID=A0A1H6IZ47_MYCRU|nr:phosphoribosyl-dephospho-CoA transferase [Mycolicibacterium rutilum]